MEENKTSVLSNGLIWFGAGVSMSEILTGTYFAPLGIKTGLFAILIGHIIGGILLFLAGYLGAKTRNNAMETVAVSFGRKGNLPFSVLNILQLSTCCEWYFFCRSGCMVCSDRRVITPVGSGRIKTSRED